MKHMLLEYLLVVNIIGFILCILDKYFAIKNKYRISEKLLILISLIGGVFGFVLGMHLIRHKTKKKVFNIPIYIILIIWIVIIARVLW